MLALHIPPMELMGMQSVKCVIKNGKWGQWVQRVDPSNLLNNMVKVREHGQHYAAMQPPNIPCET